ncbi:hypothetical protein PHET_04051 [Paragonimus heterotremus]|uniref:Uncharacterized protein n=1 Tax=Paragonimus heterotremus TaxID=100268 RepID=A0A8J4TCQ4_9TREM|nr:hypothetical protein PHET_04051 [Paragonimus heterotremus]
MPKLVLQFYALNYLDVLYKTVTCGYIPTGWTNLPKIVSVDILVRN